MNKKKEIAQTVLEELDQFNSFSAGEFQSPQYTPNAIKQTYEVWESQKKLEKEPFISYVKVREKLEDETEWKERVYLLCRDYSPLRIEPRFGTFANSRMPIGGIMSADVDDEIEIVLPRLNKKVKKTLIVLEKNNFTPNKSEKWDGIKNSMSYVNNEENLPSLRALFLDSELVLKTDIEATEDKRDGSRLAKDIEEAELAELEKKESKDFRKQLAFRGIVESIALKDQPHLDKFQNEFSRLPLSSQIVLSGSPGTGKTTTLIKRIAYKSDFQHLKSTDEIELENSRLKNWRMFTPNELLQIYLKEAMNKEGLLATDQTVVTWEEGREHLGRILKFLGKNNNGFIKSKDEILENNKSLNLTEFAIEFINFFNLNIQKNFSVTVSILDKNKPQAEIIAKENISLAQEFISFANSCKRINQLVESRKVSDADIKTLYLINDFQTLKPQLTKLRSAISDLIKKTLNDFIIQQPDVVEQISKFLAESKVLAKNEEESDLPEQFVEIDDEIIDLEDDTPEEESEIDLVEAKRKIRETIVRFAESISLKKPVKNKKLVNIWNIISPFFKNENLLSFIGQINFALRQKVFGQLDYERLIEQIPSFYEKFRLQLLKQNAEIFRSDSEESIKSKKISTNEIDVLLYVALRFAAKIFQENRNLLRNSTNFDLLERIKDEYRTQIVVDETTDFSAVQLGCMYYLAHPEFRSVAFAGDLMQRVTSNGINDWKEFDFVSDKIKQHELIISYRQTPVLLEIATKLYENIIGKEANFHSKSKNEFYFPPPLKFKTESDEDLGDWIAQRIYEIYEIYGGKNLPSIAIFVPEESDIESAYETISEKLNEFSIGVDKCEKGKVLGKGSKVRIFSVEYIKGLEFEGVFFFGIDKIYNKNPDLIDKYLYVGLTRATTFLGVTYSTKFPEKVNFIEDDFKDSTWKEFIE